MKAQEFKVGDRIEFTEDYSIQATKGTTGIVTGIEPVAILDDDGRKATQLIHVDVDGGERHVGVFNIRLKLAEENLPTFRISVGDKIGNVEYPSVEAAKEAAKLHGKKDEQFGIWEVKLLAEFSVKVTTELVAI